MQAKRGQIYQAYLDPSIGSEMSKRRPVAVISPDSMNDSLSIVQIAPITSVKRDYPTYIKIDLLGEESWVDLNHIRAISKKRLRKLVGQLTNLELRQVLTVAREIYEE